MKITDLNKMEEVVKNNPQLFWEGWTVCTYSDEDGFYSKDGSFNDNKWMKKKVFEYADGWNIPDRLIKNVQV